MTYYFLTERGKYKIYIETYNDGHNIYYVKALDKESNEEIYLKEFNTDTEAQAYIERKIIRDQTPKNKRKPIQILKTIYPNDYEEAKITSYNNNRVWITQQSEPKRHIYYISGDGYIRNTKENQEKLIKMKDLQEQKNKLYESLDLIKPEEIQRYFQEDEDE